MSKNRQQILDDYRDDLVAQNYSEAEIEVAMRAKERELDDVLFGLSSQEIKERNDSITNTRKDTKYEDWLVDNPMDENTTERIIKNATNYVNDLFDGKQELNEVDRLKEIEKENKKRYKAWQGEFTPSNTPGNLQTQHDVSQYIVTRIKNGTYRDKDGKLINPDHAEDYVNNKGYYHEGSHHKGLTPENADIAKQEYNKRKERALKNADYSGVYKYYGVRLPKDFIERYWKKKLTDDELDDPKYKNVIGGLDYIKGENIKNEQGALKPSIDDELKTLISVSGPINEMGKEYSWGSEHYTDKQINDHLKDKRNQTAVGFDENFINTIFGDDLDVDKQDFLDWYHNDSRIRAHVEGYYNVTYDPEKGTWVSTAKDGMFNKTITEKFKQEVLVRYLSHWRGKLDNDIKIYDNNGTSAFAKEINDFYESADKLKIQRDKLVTKLDAILTPEDKALKDDIDKRQKELDKKDTHFNDELLFRTATKQMIDRVTVIQGKIDALGDVNKDSDPDTIAAYNALVDKFKSVFNKERYDEYIQLQKDLEAWTKEREPLASTLQLDITNYNKKVGEYTALADRITAIDGKYTTIYDKINERLTPEKRVLLDGYHDLVDDVHDYKSARLNFLEKTEQGKKVKEQEVEQKVANVLADNLPPIQSFSNEMGGILWNKTLSALKGVGELTSIIVGKTAQIFTGDERDKEIDETILKFAETMDIIQEEKLNRTVSNKPYLNDDGNVNYDRMLPTVTGVMYDMGVMIFGGGIAKKGMMKIAKGTNKLFKVGAQKMKLANMSEKILMSNRMKNYATLGIERGAFGIGSLPVLLPHNLTEALAQVDEEFTASDAVTFAIQQSGMEAAIEMINPDFKFLRASAVKRGLKKGESMVDALKKNRIRGFANSIGQGGMEVVEEFMQNFTHGAINSIYNETHDTDFSIPGAKDYKEALHMAMLATLGMRTLSGKLTSVDNTSVIRSIVDGGHFDSFMSEVDGQVENGQLTRGEAEGIKDQVESYLAISGDLNEIFSDEDGKLKISKERFDDFVKIVAQRNAIQERMKGASPTMKKELQLELDAVNKSIGSMRNVIQSESNLNEQWTNEIEIKKLEDRLKRKDISPKVRSEVQKEIQKLKEKNKKLNNEASEYSINGRSYKTKKEFLKAIKAFKYRGDFKKGMKPYIRVKNDWKAEREAYNVMGKYAPQDAEGRILMTNAQANRTEKFIDGRTKEQIQSELKEEQIKKLSEQNKEKIQNFKNALKYFSLQEAGYVFGNKGFLVEKPKYRSKLNQALLNRSIRFAEKYGPLMGGVTEVIQTEAEWKAQGHPVGVDGYFDARRKKFFVNKQLSDKVGAVNVGQHEIFHGVIHSTLIGGDGMVTEKGMKMLNEFIKILEESDPKALKLIRKRIESEYKYNEDGTERKPEEYWDEHLELYLDLLNPKEGVPVIEYKENVWRKLIRVFKNFFKGFADNVNFETGRDLYELVGTYSKSSVKNNIEKWIIRKGKVSMTSAQEEAKKYDSTVTRESRTDLFTKSKNEFEFGLEALGIDNWQEATRDQKMMVGYMVGDVWRGYAEGILQSRQDVPGYNRHKDNILDIVTQGMEKGDNGIPYLVATWDPSQRKLSSHIIDNLANRIQHVIETRFPEFGEIMMESEEGEFDFSKLADEKTDMDISLIEEEFETGKVRKILDILETDPLYAKILQIASEQLIDINFENSLQDLKTQAKFRQLLEKGFVNLLKTDVKSIIGTQKSDKFREFLLEKKQEIIDLIAIKYKNRFPFLTESRGRMTVQQSEELQTSLEGSFVTDAQAGNEVWVLKDMSDAEFVEYFVGGRETQYKSLLNALSNELGLDAVFQSMPSSTMKYANQLTEAIKRDPRIRLSKTDGTTVDASNIVIDKFTTDALALASATIKHGIDSKKYRDVARFMPDEVVELMEDIFIADPSLSDGPNGFINVIKTLGLTEDLVKRINEGELRLHEGKRILRKRMDKFAKNSFAFAKVIDSRIPIALDNKYDLFAFHLRYLDSAKQKRGELPGTSGIYYSLLESIKALNIKQNLDYNPNAIRPMNKDANWFKREVNKIFEEKSLVKKKEALENLRAEIESANYHNIEALKDIFLKLQSAKNAKKISDDYVYQLFQAQTNLAFSFRALSTMDYIYIEEGNQLARPKKPGQTIEEWHEELKSVNHYENQFKIRKAEFEKKGLKGKKLFEKTVKTTFKDVTIKGEHLGPNANTMADIGAKIIKGDLNSDNVANSLKEHSQFFGPTFIMDIIDQKPLGKTSKEGIFRLTKATNLKKYADNIYHISGINGIVHLTEQATIEQMERRLEAKLKNTSTLNKATRASRTAKEPKGMSAWDLDDTLARTKSGVRYTLPNPEGTPQPMRKVIFLAGGPGSGKSTIIKGLQLEEQGFKIVNQDISLEWLMKNHGLPTDMKDFTPEQASKFGSLSWDARMIAKRKQTKFQGNGDGIIVDGTGNSLNVMQNQVREFENKGYDVQMIFVETSLEQALERNRARKERSLRDGIVKRTHESVQKNKEAFQELFNENFAEINTDNLSIFDALPPELVKKLDKFTKGYIKGRLDAGEYAHRGADLEAQGATFDFSEFDIIKEGEQGPLFNKAMESAKKFGLKDQFILTARPHAAKTAIYRFLDAQGLNIPFNNIITLESSTPESKALWIAKKIGEGYNNIYFADDHLANVQAVQNMLNQFDVKGKVQQAKIRASRTMNEDFNKILEDVTSIEAEKRFGATKARKRGANKGKFRVFIPPSHEDFVGLLYNFIGKGKEGDAHRNFFEKFLVRPLNRANKEFDTARQSIANDYKSLNKEFKDVRKKLNKKTPDGDFTHQDAIRIYLWDKHGYKIPGLSKPNQESLVELVRSDADLLSYAEILDKISKRDTYVSPTEGWDSGDIRMDLDDATGRVGRGDYFAEFQQNADIIFSEENLNKIEAAYGKGVREALEDMLYRIKTGKNRPQGQNKIVNRFMNYLNGSVGSVMFLNMRSALLQQMSIVNYINFADNNVFMAAKAFANQPQYWRDFAFIFNSDMLKQRRGGIRTDINGAELAETLRGSRFTGRALISKLLELGFKPTQIGDNIAIATGGATYYRNRINTYLKQGLSEKEAQAKAWTDFQALTQSTQQSARPDMVSQQQASPIGKVILNFQNITSQYNRLAKKAFQDIFNRRTTPGNTTLMQSDISNASRIAYYLAIQNLIFYSLQTALFAMMFDDDEEDERFLEKKERVLNGTIDSVLRGTGVFGAIIATLKNMTIKWREQRGKGWSKDESAVLMEMLNVSPVIGIKARKITNAEKTLNYNKNVIKEMETFDIDNPMWSAVTNYIEATTNMPLNRLYNKTQNLRQSLNNQHAAWQRVMMFFGWSQWNIGIGDTEKIQEVKQIVEEKKEIESKEKAEIKKQEKLAEEQKIINEQIEKEKSLQKEGKLKDPKCSNVSSKGARCNISVANAGDKCTVHETVEQNKTGEKTQCKGKRTNGKRCGMMTANKSGYCYYHD